MICVKVIESAAIIQPGNTIGDEVQMSQPVFYQSEVNWSR
jgi:hypothetical protein